MDVVFAVAAALAATGFAVDLWRGHRRRPRPHAAAWTAAVGMYALATWTLALGLGIGWNGWDFRVFYLLGAIVNIPVLALGSVYLVLGPTAGRRFLVAVGVFVVLGAVVTSAAPVRAIAEGGIPEGSEVFSFTLDVAGLSVPGPRVFAIIAGSVGTVVIVGLALFSAVRAMPDNRRLAAGNLLIVLGALAPAFGGSLTALGEGTGLALSLLAGAVLLWSGYRVAATARPVTASAATPRSGP